MKRKTKSTSYPDRDNTTSPQTTKAKDLGFCFNSLYKNVCESIKIVQMKLSKFLKEKSEIKRTMVLPINNTSTKTSQDIVMLPKLQQFALTDSKTYQQYMTIDNVMKKTMILLYNSIEYK